MKNIKILKIAFVLAFVLNISGAMILSLPRTAIAADPTPIQFQPQVQIPNSEFTATNVPAGSTVNGIMTSDLLAKYIQAFYNYGLAIAGILAAIVLMAGGVLWLTSAGNDSRITQAKELITGSIIGALILFGSWIILNTVNPDLLQLKIITVKTIPTITYCCDQAKGNVLTDANGKCASGSICQAGAQCINQGFDPKIANDNYFTCININKAFCCEFKASGGSRGRFCQSVAIGKSCKDVTPPHDYYSYFKSYNSFCSTRETVDSCLPEDCVGAEDASICNLDGFCYKEMCWNGAGKKDEPCGNVKDALCLPGTITNPCPDYYTHNNFTGGAKINPGRDCGSGLYCCAPTPNSK